MLMFAKDITQRDHKHPLEAKDQDLGAYMEYQRKLFPYTIVRAGLDLAYKELDDILQYVDNDFRPPGGSSRQEYPTDIQEWFRNRFPWASAFLKMEDMHHTLVILVQAMDSFRTWERMNSYHWVVLYDCVHNIIQVYNELLKNSSSNARDIHLSNSVPVNFDDFINNYWAHLDFMILSQADFAHECHRERKVNIEAAIKNKMGEGVEAITALQTIAQDFGLDEVAVAMLRRDPVKTIHLELNSQNDAPNGFVGHKNALARVEPSEEAVDVDGNYLMNFEYSKSAILPLIAVSDD